MKFAGKLAMGILIAAFALIAVSIAQNAPAKEIPEVIVFSDTMMEGNHRHVFMSIPDLTVGSNEWNDQISSIVVISGDWTFFADPEGAGEEPNLNITLGRGVYPDIAKEGIADNSISQIRLEEA
jgi:hypothetical protein